MAGKVIPHPNVATSDVGNAKLKEIAMLFNENFAALDTKVDENATNVKTLDDGKAAKDHNHDETYAKLTHEHTLADVSGLVAALDGKAALAHTHSEYLTSIPTHSHSESQIDGLLNDLANKANVTHTHAVSDVTGLASELADKVSQAQLANLFSRIPSISADTDDTKVAVAKQNQFTGRVSVSVSSVTKDQLAKAFSDALKTKTDEGSVSEVYVDKSATGTDGLLFVTGTSASVTRGDLIMGASEQGDGKPDLEDSGVKASDVSAVVDTIVTEAGAVSVPVDNVDFGEGVTNTTSANVGDQVDEALKDKNLLDKDSADLLYQPINTVASHTHGNITNDGKIGSASGNILTTTAAGAIQASSSITADKVEPTSTSGGTFKYGESSYSTVSALLADAIPSDGDTLLDSGMLKTSLGTSGKIITTGDVCDAGSFIPCGNSHTVAPCNHKHTIGYLYYDQSKDLSTYLGENFLKVTSVTGLLNRASDGTISGVTIGTANGQVAAGDHTHTASSISDLNTAISNNDTVKANSKKVSFPGFGSTETSAAKGNHTHTFSSLTSKPTTLSGYGITDAAEKEHTHDITDLTCNISGHSGNCLIVAKDSTLTHSGNRMYTMLDAATDNNKAANKIITDKDVGNGLEADTSNSIQVKAGTGITVDADGVKAKAGTGITVDSNGIGITPLTASQWMKTDASGNPSTTTDAPIVASTSSTGVVYNNSGTVSYLGTENGIQIGSTSKNLGIKVRSNYGLVADSNGLYTKVYASGGLSVDSNGLQAKIYSSGGLAVDSNGLQLYNTRTESGQTVIPYSGGTTDYDTTSWSRSSGVDFTINVATRLYKTGTTLYIMMRTLTFDKYGRLYSVGAETYKQSR